MKFITVRDLRLNPSRAWSDGDRDVVVTSNGRPVAIITPIDEDSLEGELGVMKRARALRAMERLHREAVDSGASRITQNDIDQEIARVRRKHKA